jgi:hypothetical protein
MLDQMAAVLRAAGMILLLGGMSPALAGIAWLEVHRPVAGAHLIICHIGPPRLGASGRIHWPPEFHGRKAPAHR